MVYNKNHLAKHQIRQQNTLTVYLARAMTPHVLFKLNLKNYPQTYSQNL